MIEMKVLVLGYFGFVKNQLDGQTVKTRNVYALLKKNVADVSYFDTEELHTSKLAMFRMFRDFCKASTVFYPAAGNSLAYIFPIIYILSLIFRVKINFIQIGGWLSNFLDKNPIHEFMLRRVNCVFAETETMESKLKEKHGFKNVTLLSNFRMTDFIPTPHHTEGMLKCVFMARVIKMKGIDIIFDLCDKISESGLNISVDFYGKIGEADHDYFVENLASHPNSKYCCELTPDDITEVLNNYDVMLLPTHYYTEGFPGSILEAYLSGIPVIVSDFQNAKLLVDDDTTGYIFKGGNLVPMMEGVHPIQKIEFDDDALSNLFTAVKRLYDSPETLLQLKQNAYKESLKYRPESAWQVVAPKIS